MEDDFVAIDHLLLVLIENNDSIARLLKDNGVEKKKLNQEIMSLRNGDKVTSASQEGTYKSLDKYANNLNQLAKTGKLDPEAGSVSRARLTFLRDRAEEAEMTKDYRWD